MESESPCRLARPVKAWDDLAKRIKQLALLVYSQTAVTIVEDGCSPSRVERWGLDLILRRWLSKISVLPSVHKRVVPGDCVLQDVSGHGNFLISILGQAASQFRQRVC